MKTTMKTAPFPTLLQRFFAERLLAQRGVSRHTIDGYRTTFRLLLRFAAERLGRAPSDLRLEDLDASFLGKFLTHIERDRRNCPRSRNTRLAALRSFYRFVALSEPELAGDCQRALAIPFKRYNRGPVEFLGKEEIDALVTAPDLETWVGRRDRAILLLAVQTGLRNSEIRGLRRRDVDLGTGAHVRCLGKGRKMRCTPLRRDVAAVLKSWLSERNGTQDDHVFPSSRGGSLSADALERLVARHAATAVKKSPSLAGRSVTPHTLRHSAAMELLRSGVDLSVIALWLGHESIETTQIYLHADMQLKERALAHSTSTGVAPARFRPVDPLLGFLESL
jgi:integrase/recombinase XerD